MIRYRLILAFVIAIVLISNISALAEKITIDPNTPGAHKSSDQSNNDPRLAQKVTYDSGYKRLHDVANDLTHLTGVSIVSGSSKNDWHVRDIPVVICVKDLPLRKLLDAIAAATHTKCISEKIGNDPELSYRIYRSKKEQDAIVDYNQRKKEAKLKEINWQWDAMVAYGKSKEITGDPRLSHKMWLSARVIASLGPDAKNKMLNGDLIRVNGSDTATQSIMDDLYTYAWNEWKQNKEICHEPTRDESEKINHEPTREEMDWAKLDIKLQESYAQLVLFGNFGPVSYPLSSNGRSSTSENINFYEIRNLQDKIPSLPPYPKDTPYLIDDFIKPEMTSLARLGKDWDSTILKTKIDIIKPDDNKDRTLADLMYAIASASGINIVMEDFSSQLAGTSSQIESMFKKNATVFDTLNPIGSSGNFQCEWFFGENDKLIIGCQWGWRQKHSDLLSEEYLNSLKAKLDGPGLEIDDVAHLGTLSSGSLWDWITQSKDFVNLMNTDIPKDAAWQLYDSLQPSDKLLAKSISGLPLAKFDTAWIADFYNGQKRRQSHTTDFTWHTPAENQRLEEERKLKEQVMSDPQIISTMVMRILQTPANFRNITTFTCENGSIGTSTTGKVVSESYGLHTYKMVIDYKIDGENHKIDINTPYNPFPIWSIQRQNEIFKDDDKKATTK